MLINIHNTGLERLIFLKCPYYTKQSQVQCNPYQNPNGIFHRNRTNDSKICMEPQRNLNSQSNVEIEEQN